MTDFKCSEQYAQKLIDNAGDDLEGLEDLYYQKLIERRTRRAVRVIGGADNDNRSTNEERYQK